ncbi:ubiquitin carboxyl-terminal hydrolase-domain-containing protein [Lentinula aff. lateritia]|uniref:Ubiquitin carboxyl-terminal hydrolase-domain-containing protein n=1 Tax=Lentinula aff. lateritia TaxID=2804960 RepID=A0ACC1TR35_9AGAR|nr:ubiquitin carboxyl-terminal hydrolase-domain-containing protein [Lentinula aff. lateritia]
MSTYKHSLAPIVIHAFPHPISALSFDPVSDALWVGSGNGYVSAHHSIQGLRGVCFKAGDLPVLKVVADENSVKAASAGGDGVGSWVKGGMNKWFYNSEDSIMNFATSSTMTALSTSGSELLLINAMTGNLLRQTTIPSIATHLEFSHNVLLSGSADGYLRTYDPRTGNIRNGGSESVVKAHYGGIQGLQTTGNFVFTIGMSLRQAHPFPDPLVKVYDLRNMRALPPISFAASPAFINVVPNRSATIAVTSNSGSISIVDASNFGGVSNDFSQIEGLTSFVTAVAISPTGAYLACGDADGMIHLKSQVEGDEAVPLNGFEGRPVEWANPPEPLPELEWTDSTPLNTIGLPRYRTQLLSAWTPQFNSSKTVSFPPPQKIPVQVLNTMKMNDNVAYAPLPKELRGRRNMVALEKKKLGGRFRSGKSGTGDHELESPLLEYVGDDVPTIYRHVEIEYSKFGVEDFDFGFFNKTEFSGLETHILNSYTNPILQVLHYNLPIRRLAKSHITTDCLREHCLLCELGFVVRMLEDAKGINCQSSNFCKAVGVLAHISNAIDLVDYGREPTELDYAHMIQSFQRFLFDRLVLEGNDLTANPIILKGSSYERNEQTTVPAPITQLVGIDTKNVVTCFHCKAAKSKDNLTHVVDLIYPRTILPNDTVPYSDFPTILRNSILRNMTHKAACTNCGKNFSNFSSRREISTRDLPLTLAVNACVNSEDNFKYWFDHRNQTFLKPQIELHGEVDDMEDPEGAIYQLRAVIVQVATDEHAHLVAIVKVPEAEGNEDEGASPWYIFNDFVVRNVPEQEALSFPGRWKIPAILHFERVDRKNSLDFSQLPDAIDAAILCRDTSISLNRDPDLMKHELLNSAELPTLGTVVAVDAEFVSMQQEETEYRSDGTKKVLRPARLSLARVSCLRGNGPKEGVPFIDDHIHTSEVIVDYLTEFSVGDLDPMRSPHTLTPLKVVYKKLRLLVDRGCIFIGHGLSKDFRIINIFVPPEQVIDTVDLFFIKARQRRLSLRFLSWYLFREVIQTETHDSIEDAHFALKLFKKYNEFEGEGIFDQKLEEIYKEGRQYNYKPPPPPGSSPVDRQATPPIPIGIPIFVSLTISWTTSIVKMHVYSRHLQNLDSCQRKDTDQRVLSQLDAL